ncbi:PLP-dependent transferase [Bradyrhizobium sp. NBAIM32]|nr:PLP-dependent transferase [Bradyrhizobium sp. NBAIM32]
MIPGRHRYFHAATTYHAGCRRIPRDATANDAAWPALGARPHQFGEVAGPRDIHLALLRLRTLTVRKQHWENGLKLAQGLQANPAVDRVLHSAPPEAHVKLPSSQKTSSPRFGECQSPVAFAPPARHDEPRTYSWSPLTRPVAPRVGIRSCRVARSSRQVIWNRELLGASSLFGVVLKLMPRAQLASVAGTASGSHSLGRRGTSALLRKRPACIDS